MGWTEKILAGRNAAEVKYGITPTCVVVRQEVWGELIEENFGEYVFEIENMMVAISEKIVNPFEFKIDLYKDYDREEA